MCVLRASLETLKLNTKCCMYFASSHTKPNFSNPLMAMDFEHHFICSVSTLICTALQFLIIEYNTHPIDDD
ncbi:hypothetical protein ADU59_07885 [Pararhizobium polonicum]|uniref:Uncharacterized protein n=1 Tax=Pararhizobium polonicum TaxID=1612624 RepID=A0A1C7P4V4_9HYPH|nr:hypothetical protein ADU59_07885 [Pararhizobium polonicum]